MRYTLEESTMEHAEKLAPIMNEDDKRELWASNHSTPLESLLLGVEYSVEKVTMIGAKGEIIAMLGVVPEFKPDATTNQGIIWALGSPHQFKYSRQFLKMSKNILEKWLQKYSYLENFVDVRHTRSIRWIRWLGFTIGRVELLGPDAMPFFHFYQRREK